MNYLYDLREVNFKHKQDIVKYAFNHITTKDLNHGQIVFSDDHLFTMIRDLLDNKNGALDLLLEHIDYS